MFLARASKHASLGFKRRRLAVRPYVGPAAPVARLRPFQWFMRALCGGFLSTRVVAYMYTYGRKLLRLSRKTSQLWLNLPSAHAVTRKALNVRMGKGKGARLGLNARVRVGALVLAAAGMRVGLWRKLARFVRARCGFRVYVGGARTAAVPLAGRGGWGAAAAGGWRAPRAQHLQVRRYVTPQIEELYAVLRRLNRVKMLVYFLRLFQDRGARFSLVWAAASGGLRALQRSWRWRGWQSAGVGCFMRRAGVRILRRAAGGAVLCY